jgi:prepilin-type N-terminal cleavage/methylation domain-containing protein
MKKGYLARGFTLIELMIAVTIISVLVSMGLSAYGKSRERQIGVSAGEQILSIFQSNQSDAQTGKKDCLGKYEGQQVIIAVPNTIRSNSICEDDDGIVTTTIIPGITFESGATLVFSPLTRGISLPGGVPTLTINYDSSSSLSYAIKLYNTGIIEYLGIQP